MAEKIPDKNKSSTTRRDRIVERSLNKPDLGFGDQQFDLLDLPSKAAGSDSSKKEENPFSFKKFLKTDSVNSYHSTGAKPKLYGVNIRCGQAGSVEDIHCFNPNPGQQSKQRHQGKSELPDFVQDHLVLEAQYLSDRCNGTYDLDDGLHNADNGHRTANFATKKTDEFLCNSNRLCSDKCEDQGNSALSNKNSPWSRPISFGVHSPTEKSESPLSAGLPLDLPFVGEINDTDNDTDCGRDHVEFGSSKSLPDFLSDGPIHSSLHSDGETSQSKFCNLSRTEKQSQRLSLENEKLQKEVADLKIQIQEERNRTLSVEKELNEFKCQSFRKGSSLQIVEELENNLKSAVKRAITAENELLKVKRENADLKEKVRNLHFYVNSSRNCQLFSPSQAEVKGEVLAQELRRSADCAEASLRHLLNGVENLRFIALNLESMHRFQDQPPEFPVNLEKEDSPL